MLVHRANSLTANTKQEFERSYRKKFPTPRRKPVRANYRKHR
jgi:hypothetical protein